MKKSLFTILAIINVTACSQMVTQPTETFKTKSVPEPSVSGSPDPKAKEISDEGRSPEKMIKGEAIKEEVAKPVIDYSVKNYTPEQRLPGFVSVILSNNSNIRAGKTGKDLVSLDGISDNLLQLKKITDKYKLISVGDLSLPNETEEELTKKQQGLEAYYKTEIPNLKCVQSYQFPKDADTGAIAAELRKLPFVKVAYATPVAHTSTVYSNTRIARQTTSNIDKVSPTTDNIFSSYYNENDRYWFNKHKVFQGWEVYSSVFGQATSITDPQVQKPIIAVVDSGFDVGNRHTANSPDYLPGVAVDSSGNTYYDSPSTNTYYTEEFSTDPNPVKGGQNVYSHGANTANIISAQINSGSASDSCGIIPGAKIYPVKLKDFGTTAIAKGIRFAEDSGVNIDVVSVSMNIPAPGTSNDVPIIYDTSVQTSILYATGYPNSIGVASNFVPVVIAAGNTKTNLNTYFPTCSGGGYSCYDYGQTIVGGSDSIDQMWGGNSSGSTGSCYGNIVDLVASSYNIYASNYDATAPNSYYMRISSGTSNSTPMVASTLGMMHKILKYKNNTMLDVKKLRDLVVYSGNLSMSTITYPHTARFLGKNLYDTSRNVGFTISGSTAYAEMRELNIFNALSLANNLTNNSAFVRVFNTDDHTEATTDSWANSFGLEDYFYDSTYKFNSLPSNVPFSFSSKNNGGNGSFGYQVYKNGVLVFEKMQGVLSRYRTYIPTSVPYYTQGTNYIGWMPDGNTYFIYN